MIKILHVVSSLNINAGMMSVIMNYYRHIDRSRIQFDFLYFEEVDQTHEREIQQLGGSVYYIKYPTFKPSDQKKLRLFFSKHKGEYTAVHCHPIWAAEVVGYEARHAGIKHIIQHSHSTKYAETKKSEIRNRLLLKFIGLVATEYIACSPEAAYLFGKKRVVNNEVLILPNAISLESYIYNDEKRLRVRKEFHLNDSTIVVGNIGRLCKTKNQSFLLDVFKSFNALTPDSHLIIVGEGSERELLENKIKELGIEGIVTLTGKRRDVGDILSGIDLFLMPSTFEGSPVSAIEALTSGLSCVVSDSITKNIDMEGVKYVSLNVTPDIWAKEALCFYLARRSVDRHNYEKVVKSGFDIGKQVLILEDYYLSMR